MYTSASVDSDAGQEGGEQKNRRGGEGTVASTYLPIPHVMARYTRRIAGSMEAGPSGQGEQV